MVVGDELVRVQGGAPGGGHGAGLADHVPEQLTAVGIGLNLADLQTQHVADGVDGGVDNDLLPDELIDVVLAPVCVAAAFPVALEHLFADRVGALVSLDGTEVHLHAAGGSGYAPARLLQGSAQNAGSDDAAAAVIELQQVVVVAEAVDQGDGHGVLAYHRLGVLDGLDQLGGLGHVDDAVDLALGRGGGFSAGVGAEALQLIVVVMIGAVLFLMDREEHAFLGNLLHVRLIAVDEDDVRTALAQIGSEDAAGSAGAIHKGHVRRAVSEPENGDPV